jgi:hypothetical protein
MQVKGFECATFKAYWGLTWMTNRFCQTSGCKIDPGSET